MLHHGRVETRWGVSRGLRLRQDAREAAILPTTPVAGLVVAGAVMDRVARAASSSGPDIAPAAEPGGMGGAVAILIVGAAVLAALLVAVAARSGRPPASAPPRRTEAPASDPWREAGRRHQLTDGGTDDDEGAFG